MSNFQNNLNGKEFIQFSKKLAKWSIISVIIIVLCAYGLISFFDLNMDQTEGIAQIAQAGIVAITLVVASYMGNSGVEKLSAAKYGMKNIFEKEVDNNGAG